MIETAQSFRATWQGDNADPCCRVFSKALDVWNMPIAGRVLEIGCAEFNWMSLALSADPTLDLFGIDWRPCERPGTVIRGDVLSMPFAMNAFDWIIAISTIEHIGLGRYDRDPVVEDGDTQVMRRIAKWLKPGGSVFFDVPYAPEGYQVVGVRERWYDDAAVNGRLLVPGLRKVRQGAANYDASAPFTEGEWPKANSPGVYPWALANWWQKVAA